MKFPLIRRGLHERDIESFERRLKATTAARDREKQKRIQAELKLKELRRELAKFDMPPKVTSPQHLPTLWQTDRVHFQIDQTWSDDQTLGINGFVVVKEGLPQDVRITCGGAEPHSIHWNDREDVYKHESFAAYAKNLRCGFHVTFRRLARHGISIELPGMKPENFHFDAAGFWPLPTTEPKGMSFDEFTERVNGECQSVLEIGSRVVSPGSKSKRDFFAPHIKYTGFDYYGDSNTDVVGDAHQLSSYFPEGTQFDAIFSLAVMEHLATPWKVAMEINKLLPVGGLAYHLVPFAWPFHEKPWDFWRYSYEGLRALFSPGLGFEVLSVGHTSPCRIVVEQPDEMQALLPWTLTWADSNILVRKVRDYSPDDFRWNASLEQMVVPGTAYPLPASA